MFRLLMMMVLSFSLMACASHAPYSLGNMSELAQGKRYFESGYYKRSMKQLLPLACDGNAEAQYAVGYMYYYGYGVAQDTDVGFFWIQRSANQGYGPAREAFITMRQDCGKNSKLTECVISKD